MSCLVFASLSHAQCDKDTDCKGDRVCEAGVCVSPPPAAAPAPEPALAPAPAPAPAPAAPLAEPSRPISTATMADEPRDTKPRRDWKRHSTGMMAGGIVMVSFVPIALLAAMVADLQQTACEAGGTYSLNTNRTSHTDCDRYDATIYGGIISGVVLLGAGIPMIVVGAKREPLAGGSVKLAPWATPSAAGLRLHLDL